MLIHSSLSKPFITRIAQERETEGVSIIDGLLLFGLFFLQDKIFGYSFECTFVYSFFWFDLYLFKYYVHFKTNLCNPIISHFFKTFNTHTVEKEHIKVAKREEKLNYKLTRN